MIRVLIVDDEPSARTRIRTLIQRYGDLTIVGECATVDAARSHIAKVSPEIVFLDIQMPGGSPIEMLRTGPSSTRMAVIFVTAHSTFAVDAFDVDAADYLLKPFTAARFEKALAKAREKLVAVAVERLRLRKTDGRVVSLAPAEIVWIEASGNNLTLHLRSSTLELRATLSSFCERVERFGFTRIHRSFAINGRLVRQLEPWSHGEYVVVMDDGTRLNSSRTFRANLAPMLRQTAT